MFAGFFALTEGTSSQVAAGLALRPYALAGSMVTMQGLEPIVAFEEVRGSLPSRVYLILASAVFVEIVTSRGAA
ncbi:MAG: hypothetical protein A2Y76_15275 [Planctomycetes bacterium RBG_13_60_9]|nr:MAG: hypothetical protein A2Y76_15275 [Planctomycetes bacterium RBG_13_60_9]